MIFYKYQGTGNDFILIDNRAMSFDKENTNLIKQLCDRRFGIGADGLILLENDCDTDFKMVYYNADGNISSMCGNGGRCIVSFAKRLGIFPSNKTTFMAPDGIHYAQINEDQTISLKMNDITAIESEKDFIFLDSGSPHHIVLVNNLEQIDVKKQGAIIRYSPYYTSKGGTNVNFVEQIDNHIFRIRTYERGVEDETLSCGTGATAVAIAMHHQKRTTANTVRILVEGGELTINFEKKSHYQEIYLTGKATFVFEGNI